MYEPNFDKWRQLQNMGTHCIDNLWVIARVPPITEIIDREIDLFSAYHTLFIVAYDMMFLFVFLFLFGVCFLLVFIIYVIQKRPACLV